MSRDVLGPTYADLLSAIGPTYADFSRDVFGQTYADLVRYLLI